MTEPRSQQPPLRTREGASKMEDIRKSAEALTAVRSISDKPVWLDGPRGYIDNLDAKIYLM